MTLSVQLRSPVAEDAPALVLLIAELGASVSEAAVRSNIGSLANGPDDRAWVAEDASGILGLVGVHLIPLFHATERLGRITSLVVRGCARGNGVGRALMQRAEEFCWDSGCARIELTSADQRRQAHRFYERLGFELRSRRFVKYGAPTVI